MAHLLHHHWWAIALRGIVAIVFGAMAIAWPGITLFALIILFGAYALVDGAFSIIAGARAVERHVRWWPLILEGVAGIAIGIVTWVWPGLTALALLYVIGAWALLTGFLEVVSAVRLRHAIEGELFLGVSGILSIIFGLLLFVFPGSGALAVVWLIGLYALLFGILLLWLAYRLRAHQHGEGPSSGMASGLPA